MREASDADLDGKLAVVQRELNEALERQAATDEVLRVSPTRRARTHERTRGRVRAAVDADPYTDLPSAI